MTLAILRVYCRLARPEVWLFPGRDETKLIDVCPAVRRAPRPASTKAEPTSLSTTARWLMPHLQYQRTAQIILRENAAT
ncbi:hypothetical protein LJR235_001116 [Pararhizobium sp. LjRoot235]|uniref:hypothetical protein n=1 Tax=Pararhizobium sp. LjRoot235 TaxID=3342291 RepID=UPI003ED131BD